MKVISLQSGSNGNCFYVEAGGARLLFDAGISARQAQLRLAVHGCDILEADALLISHDHSDHSKSMGIFHRKFGVPVYATRRTVDAARRYQRIGEIADVRIFSAGSSLVFGPAGDVLVHTVPTPHDSADGVAFIIEHDGSRVGIMTDLGHAFDGLREVLESLDAVIIESNYDDQMLENGRYPMRLKQRIRGAGGHLSNDDSAVLIRDAVSQSTGSRLQWACLCHLSEDNNCPDVAVEAHVRLIGDQLPIYVASRDGVSDVMEVVPRPR